MVMSAAVAAIKHIGVQLRALYPCNYCVNLYRQPRGLDSEDSGVGASFYNLRLGTAETAQMSSKDFLQDLIA